MKRTPLRQLARALAAAPLAWAFAAGCEGPLDLALTPPARLALADDSLEPPAPVSATTLGPGNLAPTQDRLAQPTLTHTTRPTPSAAPGQVARLPSSQLLADAAARLADRDFASAAVYLQRYLRLHPDSTIVRLQLGELYYRMQRWEEARHQFATALTQCDEEGLPVRHVLHGHSRLLDLAELDGDTFEAALHRGIGLALLAEKRRDDGPATTHDVTPPELFAKARAALQTASQCRPTDPRPHVYLIPAWLGLHQAANARLALHRAESLALTTPLGPVEAMCLARWALELR